MGLGQSLIQLGTTPTRLRTKLKGQQSQPRGPFIIIPRPIHGMLCWGLSDGAVKPPIHPHPLTPEDPSGSGHTHRWRDRHSSAQTSSPPESMGWSFGWSGSLFSIPVSPLQHPSHKPQRSDPSLAPPAHPAPPFRCPSVAFIQLASEACFQYDSHRPSVSRDGPCTVRGHFPFRPRPSVCTPTPTAKRSQSTKHTYLA